MRKRPDAKKAKAIEPHELAGELTHEQRAELAKGLVALYRRKVAEEEAFGGSGSSSKAARPLVTANQKKSVIGRRLQYDRKFTAAFLSSTARQRRT